MLASMNLPSRPRIPLQNQAGGGNCPHGGLDQSSRPTHELCTESGATMIGILRFYFVVMVE